jgi:hypothetical protein
MADDDRWKNPAMPSSNRIEAISQRLGIRWDEVRTPMVTGILLGYTTAHFRAAVTSYVRTAELAVNRELTADEVMHLAELRAQSVRVQSLEVFPVAVTTYALVRRSMTTFRFPFWQPKPATFLPDVFPSPRATLLRGTPARLSWHALRIGAYALVTHWLFGPLFFGYVAVTSGVHMSQHPNLKEYRQDLLVAHQGRKKLRAEKENNGSQPNRERRGGMPERVVDPGEERRVDWEKLQGRDTSSSPPQEDYSEQSTSSTEGYETYQSGSSSVRVSSQPRVRHDSQQQPLPAQVRPDDDPFADDDASPVARSSGWPSQPVATTKSSWEQVRRGSRPADSEPQPTDRTSWAENRRGAGQTPQDYSYTNPDDGKSPSKEESQKRFDDMLEKERRGETEPRRKW